MLIKEKGKWKNHAIDIEHPPYDGLFEFSNFELLENIKNTGFVYKSGKHARLWPFVPSSELKSDSFSVDNNILSESADWYNVAYFKKINFNMRLLKKIGGKWNGYDLELKKMPDSELFQSVNLERLNNIMQSDFIYKSKNHAGAWPFEPGEPLKTDSVE